MAQNMRILQTRILDWCKHVIHVYDTCGYTSENAYVIACMHVYTDMHLRVSVFNMCMHHTHPCNVYEHTEIQNYEPWQTSSESIFSRINFEA